MSISTIICSYILIGGMICAVIHAFAKHFFHRRHTMISRITIICLILFGFFLLAKVEYFPALQHLSYYRDLQDASGSKITSRETLLFLDGCEFRLKYQDDPNIVYFYRYTIGKGMRCTVKSTTDGSAYLDMLYPPRSGYITLP